MVKKGGRKYLVKSGGRVTTITTKTPTTTTPFPEEEPVNAEVNSEKYQENIEEEPYGEGKVEVKAPKVYGKFTELKHGVSGKVSGSEERRTLEITDFNYSGKGTKAIEVFGSLTMMR